jgi:hypothetical protein
MPARRKAAGDNGRRRQDNRHPHPRRPRSDYMIIALDGSDVIAAFAPASSGRSPFCNRIDRLASAALRSRCIQKSHQRDTEILGQTGLAIDIAASSC